LKKKIIMTQRIITRIASCMNRIFLSPEISGTKNLDEMLKLKEQKGCAIVLIANHLSANDPFLINGAMPVKIRLQIFPTIYPAKVELFSNKFKSFVMTLLGCIPVADGHGKNVKELVRLVKNREAIFLFPEGTVSKSGAIGEDQGALTFFSRFSEIIVQPIRIDGMKPFGKDWRNMFLGRRTLAVSFGKPFVLPKGSEINAMDVIQTVKI
jgi:1-acyl-sn-glycerol-3-phosphate acyltransferase